MNAKVKRLADARRLTPISPAKTPVGMVKSAADMVEAWQVESARLATTLFDIEWGYADFSSEEVKGSARQAIINRLKEVNEKQSEAMVTLFERIRGLVSAAAGGGR